MLSRTKGGIGEFEWDTGNLDKSYLKHGITPKEAEEIFVNEGSLVLPDLKHSQKEDRFIIVGQNFVGVYIFVVLTVRNNRVRIISARKMHRKEVKKYVQVKKNSQI